MKTFTLTLFFLLSLNTYSQKFGPKNLFFLIKTKNTEFRIDFLLSKKFEQQNSIKDPKLKFINKQFNKRSQEMDEEVVTIENDTIKYILKNPKKFIKFKKRVEFECRANPVEKLGDIKIYKNRYYIISIKE